MATHSAVQTALAVLDTLEQDKLLENASETGHYLLNLFKKELIEIPGVSDIRGVGLLQAIELDHPCAELVQQALDNSLLINVTAGKRDSTTSPSNYYQE